MLTLILQLNEGFCVTDRSKSILLWWFFLFYVVVFKIFCAVGALYMCFHIFS